MSKVGARRTTVRSRRKSYIALSGTPGTGKSSVAALLPKRWAPSELGELAIELGTGRRVGGRTVRIDLARTIRWLPEPEQEGEVLVGHLAHFLPVRSVVLLRCHPLELARRLDRAGRGSRRQRRDNVTAEAIDLLLAECRSAGRRVVQVDTTGRSVGAVAREVAKILRRGGRLRGATIDWLADPTVTDYLLRRTP